MVNFPPKETASTVTGLRPPARSTSPRVVVATSGFGLAGAAAVGYVLGGTRHNEISAVSAIVLAVATFVLGIVLGSLVRGLLDARRLGEATEPSQVTCNQNLRLQLDVLELFQGKKGMSPVARAHAAALGRDLACVGLGWLAPHLADAVDPKVAPGKSSGEGPVEAVSPLLVFQYARDLVSAGPSCSAMVGAVGPPERATP